MLSLIGLGLSGIQGITLGGVDAIKNADVVYLEGYTSRFPASLKELEVYFHQSIRVLQRQDIEEKSARLLQHAREKHVALLVMGNPLFATTHISFVLQAKKESIPVHVYHNTSVFDVVANTGLSLYKFGAIASVPFHHEHVTTPYDVLVSNGSLHTLFLLDLDDEHLMSAADAVDYLLRMEEQLQKHVFSPETLCVVGGGLGRSDEVIFVGTARDVLRKKIGVYPQCLIVPGKLHFIEEEALALYRHI